VELADKKCRNGVSVPPLKVLRERELLKELGQGWTLNGRGHLMRLYTQKVLFLDRRQDKANCLRNRPTLSDFLD